MQIHGPKFTFTDLQIRNDIRKGKPNKKAAIIADELDRTATKHSPKYQAIFYQGPEKIVSRHMQFSRLL